jgi:hypothetical protein
MDRAEKSSQQRQSEFANKGEIPPKNSGENDTAASEINKPIGAEPHNEVTGRHDSGSAANETVDGLTAAEETLRRAAEDTPSGQEPEAEEDVPVFDRADELPKI